MKMKRENEWAEREGNDAQKCKLSGCAHYIFPYNAKRKMIVYSFSKFSINFKICRGYDESTF